MANKRKYTKKMEAFVKSKIDEGFSVTKATKLMAPKFGLQYDETMGRKFREKMQESGVTKNVKRIEDTEEFKKAKLKKHNSKKKRFILTWCQNNTKVHTQLLDNIEVYAKEIGAEILVVAGRYLNVSLFNRTPSETWDRRVQPYLTANRHHLNDNLQLLGDIKTNPTAVNPIQGLQSLTGLESTIVGHPKQALESLPVLEGYPNKLLLSTGAVTVDNYSDSSAGAKGKFHHVLGFTIVETQDDLFYIRQVSADKEGNFFDLDRRVENGKVTIDKKAVDTVVLGDLHTAQLDEESYKVSLTMLHRFNPKHVVLHDIFDSQSVSHHHLKNPFTLLQKEQQGITLTKEINEMKDIVEQLLPFNPVVVAANHNDHLDKFLMDVDWRKSPFKYEYLKYALAVADGKCPKGVVAYILEEEFGKKVRCLDYNDSFRRCGVELGTHGNIGANGSRGGVNQYKYFNTKMICGHSHTPRKQLGFTSVGTLSKLRMDYNIGASSWMNSNAILHKNGKSQLIHIIKGGYSTL